ncbi:CaiB/BaiF CoA transferase family protein [Novosphingobium rosa]|uniref:CaiB/BaiF CoA transferase family protein n=1 Tax=Novosphingobium rosa TaxID=76978 RepID=UPI00082EE727|nr:CaiB/BaiF CoA-transferase family protein [Novosphingobium rosa]
MRPLEGITVVSLEHAIAAPFATRQLADLGARVIKIERPEVGDFARSYDERVEGLSSHFVWTNRSKESLDLDLKSEIGREALSRLIAKADVLVQNLAPGATARMGLDYESLSAINPGIILCEISGYGQDGPHRDRKAYDLLIQSESGFLSVTGTSEEMAKAGCSIADIAAGMYAYTNILAALIERNQTGKGKHIDVSMLEAMAEWMGFPLYYAFQGASQPPRVGASHATIFPYGPFATAGGEVMLGIQNEREWQSFCTTVLHLPELARDARFVTNSLRSANRAELGALIARVFSQLPRQTVVDRLDEARIANANVNDMAGLWNHPQLAARNRWVDVETPAGRVPALLPPGQKEARMDPIPALGAHTQAILRELGLEDAFRAA